MSILADELYKIKWQQIKWEEKKKKKCIELYICEMQVEKKKKKKKLILTLLKLMDFGMSDTT